MKIRSRRLLLVALALVSAGFAPRARAVEHLVNGTFDTNIANWSSQAAYITPSPVVTGNPGGAMEIVNSAAFAGPTSLGVVQCVNGFTGNMSYTLSGQVDFTGATAGYAQMVVAFYPACNCAGSSTGGFTTNSVIQTSPPWSTMTGTGTSPAIVESALVSVWLQKTPAGGSITADFDNLSLTGTGAPARSVTISPSGSVSFCGSGLLTANETGGSGCTSVASYQWYRGGVAIGGATASTYNASITGSYTVTVTDSSGTVSAPSAATNVTVNAVPGAPTATNSGPVCAGSTLSLMASTVAGGTYAWTGPGGFTSALQNPSIANATTAATGTYSVRVTVNGCQSAAGTTSATVKAVPATPTPSSNSPVCTGATLNLSTPAVTGATYAWTGPNGFTSTSRTPSVANVTAADAGSYTVHVTVNGCQSAAGSTSVSVTTDAAAGPTVTAPAAATVTQTTCQ